MPSLLKFKNVLGLNNLMMTSMKKWEIKAIKEKT